MFVTELTKVKCQTFALMKIIATLISALQKC